MGQQQTPAEIAVYNRLTELGVSNYNQHRHVIKALASSVSESETIQAVVVGRTANHTSALFALTDTRLFYVEGDALYHSTNVIALGSVTGTSLLPTPILSSVTIESRAGTYVLQDVNKTNARDFVKALSKMINKSFEGKQQPTTTSSLPPDSPDLKSLEQGLMPTPAVKLSDTQLSFLEQHNIGILSTSNANGLLQSNPVYYVIDGDTIYILTREDTHKSQNMMSRPQSNLVVIDQDKQKSLTISALSKEVSDLIKKQIIYTDINQIIQAGHTQAIQPSLYDTTKGNYTVFSLIPMEIRGNVS